MIIIICVDLFNIGSTCFFIITIQFGQSSQQCYIDLHMSIEFTSCLFYMLIPLQTLSIHSTGYNNNVSRCAKRAFEKLTKSLVTNHLDNLSIFSFRLCFVLFGLWGSRLAIGNELKKLFHLILHSSFIIVLSLS